LAGFISAEGCFFIDIQSSGADNIGKSVTLRFKIAQHTRDEQLLLSFKTYFGCGNYYSRLNIGYFTVAKFSDLNEKIIPFLNKYPILGVKGLDYAYFCEAGEVIKAKEHLTELGLKKIIEIKAKMNK
jgi:LAGLIDADG endonuclease